MLATVISAVIGGLGTAFVLWLRERQARKDAIARAAAEAAIAARLEAAQDKARIDQAMEKVLRDPKPNMSDWN